MFKGLLQKIVKEVLRQEKEAERKVRIDEAVFSGLPVGISYLTPDLRLVRITPSAQSRKGLPAPETEAEGRRAGAGRYQDIFGIGEVFRTGRPFRLLRQVTDELTVENIGFPVRDEAGGITSVIVIDFVTENPGQMDMGMLRQHIAEMPRPSVAAAGPPAAEPAELGRAEVLETIVEGSPDAIFTMDAKWRINFTNKAVGEVFGRPASSVVGKRFDEFVMQSERQRFEKIFRMVAENGERLNNLKVTILSGDGSKKHLGLSLSPLTEEDSEHMIIGIARDVTEDVKFEKVKEESIALLSHDLKTPLTSIVGYTSLLLNGEVGKVEGDVKTCIEGIDVNCQKMLGMVKNFLSAGKIEEEMLALNPRPMKIDTLIMESLKHMDPQVRDKGLIVETRFSPGLPQAVIDRDQMERVINNLLSNAIKFTPPGGKISINSSQNTDGYITLEVSDTGAGIPQEDLPMLFDKYYQGKGSGRSRGTGLGLYIAKNIVEAHQGNIKVSSPQGQGTTFTIRLPRID